MILLESAPDGLTPLSHVTPRIEAGRVDEVICVFVEENEDNFRDLRSILAGLPPTPGIRIISPRPASFECMVEELIPLAKPVIGIPSFWFIDPFGYSDFSFETVAKIMSLNRSEVFVNLMVGFLQRFLNHPDLDATNDPYSWGKGWVRAPRQVPAKARMAAADPKLARWGTSRVMLKCRSHRECVAIAGAESGTVSVTSIVNEKGPLSSPGEASTMQVSFGVSQKSPRTSC